MKIKSSTIGGLAVAAIMLSACAQAPLGQGPNANRNQGAVLGGLGGAALGQAIGGNTEGTVIGAAIGAGAGALIGSDLDRQEAELRRDLQGSGVDIQNTGEELLVTLPENITFATDSATVMPSFQNQLAALANNLRQFPNSRVSVTGHTDSTGSTSYNQGLSERRASAVANVLIQNGVASNRLFVSGAGETQPVASNDTTFGRQQNRRVEIVITPTG